MKGKVCVFGSFNFDVVATLPRFPLPGESLVAKRSMMGPGGKGANQATAAARAGARVHYIGKVGNDEFGKTARRSLEQAGFDVLTLFVSRDAPTGNALIYVAGKNAENMIAVDPGANLTVSEQEVNQCLPALAAADLLLTQLENNLGAIEKMIDVARRNNTYIILNPAPYQPVPERLLAEVDLLTPNATEAGQMTGITVDDRSTALCAAALLHRRGAKNVIITLGIQGALLSETQGQAWIPCFPARPLDSTGAGDAFNGALAARLAAGESLREAALFAAAYAAVCVERAGAAASMPSLEETVARLNQYPDIQIEALAPTA
ncbi:ribokinase [Sodalis ligni]|jgi:ribokinase|uniref:Ribokinase n=1 Tax=Sodalis ligni TaxID=2697027 RepID=A0A4R1NMG6_9GAMM|nr:ribokinase [Sodalis ligni]TCL05450.1 ribokinase [Sodalis ligni]